MAGGMDLGGGKGGKKSLDTAINLVPFIDLMAVTISFLIMTAVWNQISKLQVSVSGPSSGGEAQTPQEHLNIIVVMTEKGFTINTGSALVTVDKNANNKYVYCRAGTDAFDGDINKCDENTLIGQLRKVKAKVPEQQNITVNCEGDINYSDLMRVIDTCNIRDANKQPVLFPDVSVGAAS